MARPERFTPSRPRPQQDRPSYQDRPGYGDNRPAFGGAGGPGPGGPGRPAFGPRPAFAGPRPADNASSSAASPAGAPVATVRLRDGEREVVVTGTPAFIRQTMDDLPSLFQRLTGVSAPTPSAISIAAPSGPPAGAPRQTSGDTSAPPASAPSASPSDRARPIAPGAGDQATDGFDTSRNAARSDTAAGGAADAESLERDVFAVLRRSKRPLKVAEIRAQLDGHVTGQQVRRILERSDRVLSNSDKPAGYRLR